MHCREAQERSHAVPQVPLRCRADAEQRLLPQGTGTALLNSLVSLEVGKESPKTPS